MLPNFFKADKFTELLERVQAGIIARAGLKFAAPVISRQDQGQQ